MRMILFALLLFSAHASAALVYDLSDVDPASASVTRYASWAGPALTGKPPYGFSAADAVNLSRLTGNDAWCQLATDMVETSVAKAESDIADNKRPDIGRDSYLYVGPEIEDLAFTYTYCPQVTAEQKTRWGAFAEQAIWNVWNNTKAEWAGLPFTWSGWSVNNPGNNYYYSFLLATMDWGFAKEPGTGTDWIQWLRDNKIQQVIDYYTANGAGGGSREGTGYGTAHSRLFGVYKIWKDNTPEHQDLANATVHLRDSVEYLIHATMPDFTRFAPLGDQSRVSYPALYDYHRCYEITARRQAPEPQASMATWWLNRITPSRMTAGFNFSCELPSAGTAEVVPTKLYHHATSAGHLFARDSWTDQDAMWWSFVAGKYDESHAGQVQGSFILFRGDFLAVTENIFSHSGIHQEAAVQNVIRFDKAGTSVAQKYLQATSMQVTEGADGALTAEADLSPFYPVATTGVTGWTRKIVVANKTMEITDNVGVNTGTEAIWQINTPAKPIKISDTIYEAGGLRITIQSPADPEVSIVDWNEVNPTEYHALLDPQCAAASKGWLANITCSGSDQRPTIRVGYKLEIRGATTEYKVKLDTGIVSAPPVEEPPVIEEPPVDEPPVVTTPPTPDVTPVNAVVPRFAGWVAIETSAACALPASWHYQCRIQWVPAAQLTIDDIVATCRTTSGDTCGSTDRMWNRVNALLPSTYVRVCDVEPVNMTSRNGCLAANDSYQLVSSVSAENPVDEPVDETPVDVPPVEQPARAGVTITGTDGAQWVFYENGQPVSGHTQEYKAIEAAANAELADPAADHEVRHEAVYRVQSK